MGDRDSRGPIRLIPGSQVHNPPLLATLNPKLYTDPTSVRGQQDPWVACRFESAARVVSRVPDECPAEVETVIQDCLEESGDDRPDMKTVFERLRAAANVPAPDGAPTPSATSAMSSPQWSRDGSTVPRSGPKSNRSAPKTGDYVQRLGLAAAMKMRLGAHYSSGPPKSSTGLHTQR